MADRITTPAQERASTALHGHRWWGYRACAPSPDAPGMAAGDDTVAATVWLTQDRETQKDRLAREQTAIALCGRCPVRAMCLEYALGDAAGAYEAENIWGGMTAHQRAELSKARRRLAAVEQRTVVAEPIPATALDLDVLRALAAHRTQEAVARAVGMTVTRANWHRSRLVSQLNLDPKTATRMRLIYTARLTGLLDPATGYLADRDRVIAAIPSRQGAVLRSRGIQLALPGLHGVTGAARPGGPAGESPAGGPPDPSDTGCTADPGPADGLHLVGAPTAAAGTPAVLGMAA